MTDYLDVSGKQDQLENIINIATFGEVIESPGLQMASSSTSLTFSYRIQGDLGRELMNPPFWHQQDPSEYSGQYINCKILQVTDRTCCLCSILGRAIAHCYCLRAIHLIPIRHSTIKPVLKFVIIEGYPDCVINNMFGRICPWFLGHWTRKINKGVIHSWSSFRVRCCWWVSDHVSEGGCCGIIEDNCIVFRIGSKLVLMVDLQFSTLVSWCCLEEERVWKNSVVGSRVSKEEGIVMVENHWEY